MQVLTLGELLVRARSVLGPPRGQVPFGWEDARVEGFEIFEGPGRPYDGAVVVLAGEGWGPEELRRAVQACQKACAVVLPPVSGVPGSWEPQRADIDGGPVVLLERAGEVSASQLASTLVQVLHDARGAQADDALTRQAAWAAERQESALVLLLEGTPDAATPAALVGLRPDLDYVVVAAGGITSRSHREEVYRLAVRAEFPSERSVFSETTTGEVVLMSVIPLPVGAATNGEVASRLRGRLDRAVRSGADLPVAVGSVVSGLFALHVSAGVARETLRALRFRLGVPWQSGLARVRVATTMDVSDALALIRAGDALRQHGGALAEPLMILAEHDDAHGTALLPSVLVALEYRGNMTTAAKQLGIHANSLRVRLERVKELSGIDLDDPVSALRAVVAFLANPDAHHAARPMPPLIAPPD